MRVLTVVGALALVAVASGVWALAQVADPFPHADHEGLFPLCAGCHVGIETGVGNDFYPDPSSCTRCHDGQREPTVEWSGPTSGSTNLVYSHTRHEALVAEAGESADCVTCHQEVGAEVRMAVAEARSETCLQCHEAPQHLSYVSDCAACHVSVWEATDLSMERLAALPQPDDHGSPDFLFEHGQFDAVAEATCATCHARQSCERCHVNAAAVPAIASLGSDGRIASLVGGIAAEYPLPAEHQTSEWAWEHAVAGNQEIGACANCHTQPSCTSCHVERVNDQIERLPLAEPEGPPGVAVVEGDSRVHQDDFAFSHRSQAAAREESCLGCHVQDTCISCHDGPDTPVFHERNFLEVHAPSAYRNQTDCASCHTTEVFCRTCHQSVGLTSAGTTDVVFHDQNSTWLFGHGAPARLGLEGCVTCHTQADCTQCHSASSGFRINPHGPGFDPVRAAEANRSGCLVCHRGGPP